MCLMDFLETLFNDNVPNFPTNVNFIKRSNYRAQSFISIQDQFSNPDISVIKLSNRSIFQCDCSELKETGASFETLQAQNSFIFSIAYQTSRFWITSASM